MQKKEPLYVGQKVWLETTRRHGCDVRYEDEPSELIVLEANKTSAYMWFNDKAKVRYKVDQKTRAVSYCIPDGRLYRLWLSIEDYKRNVAYEKEKHTLLQEARKKISSMSLEDLRSFVGA
jgi:hypothetical protein